MTFEKYSDGLVPAIIQDSKTKTVLMLGFMNAEAIELTKSTGKVTFFSRTKNRLWTKGEESGNFLHFVSMKEDCDKDTLLIAADPVGPVCHTGAATCFDESNEAGILNRLQQTIAARYADRQQNSYTSELFEKGINAIAQKVGEEAVELIIEAKDDDRAKFLGEAADLLYHYLVLLQAKGVQLKDVEDVLQGRHKK